MVTKKTYITLIFLVLYTFSVKSQDSWSWTELNSMPEAVSNNSVTSAYRGDSLCVYSFTGIDESKTPAGIHLKSWRYNTVSEVWTALPDVPDFQGKIAASVSTVGNKIYLIGGYYVEENFSEESSDDVHIFDPESNSWLDDGANIPVPIDDHFQGVWRDSLIFIVTGWSDSQNVRDVQIYNPELDEWSAANDLPFTSSFPVFGTSGSIVNDTIFYFGGVNNSFNTMSRLRRGIINSDDPTEIVWDVVGESPSGDAYRFASMQYQGRVFFVGGSNDGYNFDGISYDTGMGVEAQNRIVTYYSQWGIWEDEESPFGVMDLRGIAQVSETSWIICGGMMGDQEVSDRVFILSFDPTVNIEESLSISAFKIYFDIQNSQLVYSNNKKGETIEIYSMNGQFLNSFSISKEAGSVFLKNLTSGAYIGKIVDSNGGHIDSIRFFND